MVNVYSGHVSHKSAPTHCIMIWYGRTTEWWTRRRPRKKPSTKTA